MKKPTIPVVGIGASAGGLEALKTLVASTGDHTDAAYIIVQHLAPDQKSILHELLQAQTDLLVKQIVGGEIIQENVFYVAPPGKVAAVVGDTLQLSDRTSHELLHRPIDSFLRSLATELERDAYCVILSGTGTDGSAGLRAVKAAGGFALVQESKGARFPGMPDSAVATGLVDFVLPVERIAGRLHEIMQYRRRMNGGERFKTLKKKIEEALPRLTDRIAAIVGNDFSDYKHGTLVRRIERRMAVLRIADVEDFIHLLDDEKEARLLAQEFLIGVTEFFRDPGAFEALRKLVVIPMLDNAQGKIRIWVPGCSTGEEAYSIAILFIEEMEARKDRRVVQVFGTDIDTSALVIARYGLFPASAVEKLGEERRRKFFQLENGQYRALPVLRETCVFAPHNLLRDPPFSRLDLISCRNLLIYIGANQQKQIIPRFHFALRGKGYLFLGQSEGLAGEERLFDVLDKDHRVFQKNSDAHNSHTPPKERTEKLAQLPFDPRLSMSPRNLGADVSHEVTAERDFLRSYAAPFALLSREGEVLFLSHQMTKFVQPSQGRPSTAIDAYLAPELRLPVRTALAEANRKNEAHRIENVMVIGRSNYQIFDIEVAPSGADFILVLTQVRASSPVELSEAISERSTGDRDILEAENIQLRRQLSTTLREVETYGQELKNTNDRLTSINSDLQTSNEELETSGEELQSINEELETVNSELFENNNLLSRANSDLKNLFEATDLAVLFLDRQFCVRNYTESTTRLYGIRARDVGRPIFDLSSHIDYPDLEADARLVDETLQPFEREVHIRANGHTFLVRIKPYRTIENHLDGYVLSFIDITSRKKFEETLRHNEEAMAQQYAELENLYDTTPVGLSLMGADMRWIRINKSLAQINGFPVEEHIGKTFKELLPGLKDDVEPVYHQILKSGVPVLNLEIEGKTNASPDTVRNWIADFYPVWQGDKIFAVGACVREVTEEIEMQQQIRKQSEQQRLLLGELQHRVKNTLTVISSISALLLDGATDAHSYQARLEHRIEAIARTHDLLTDTEWTTTTFSRIVANEARPFEGQPGVRVKTVGPELTLSAEQAIALGMATHELMTNAAKYGALSVENGYIEIKTSDEMQDGKRRACIVWKEHGGPKLVSPPKRKGFGSLVLERVLKSDLSGEVVIKYNEDGLHFSVCFDLMDE